MSHTRLLTFAFLFTTTLATSGCGFFRRGYVVYATPPPAEPTIVVPVAEPAPPPAAPKPAPRPAEKQRTIVVHAPPGSTVIVNPEGATQVIRVPGEAPPPPAAPPPSGGWNED